MLVQSKTIDLFLRIKFAELCACYLAREHLHTLVPMLSAITQNGVLCNLMKACVQGL